MYRTTFTTALVASVAMVRGAIQIDNDLWSGTNTSRGVTFENGIPSSSDPKLDRRIKHAFALEED